jgi:uncharacterized membrane protein YhhN
MFTEVSANYFIYGLASFLLAHIMYILVFSKKRSRKPSVYFIIILLIYVLALLSLIFKGLGEMMVPVFLYIAAIMTMVVYASMREKEKSISSYNLVFLGAICFMVSDSLIALNKFHAPLPLSNLSIMFTYGIAQLLIVLGILKQN